MAAARPGFDRPTGAASIDNLQAWLTTVVSRLCLDRLTSAVARRETYVGQWLPEPIVTPLVSSSAPPDPLEAVVRDEDNRFAALVVLDVLPPDQRVAFVLHDAFGVPFGEIADVLGIEPANARQLASRARRSLADPPPPVPDEEHNAAVGRFLEAMATGDLNAVLATLHPDALVMGDANGTTNTAVNVIHGADKFARFYLGLLQSLRARRLVDLGARPGQRPARCRDVRLAGRVGPAELAAARRGIRGARRPGLRDVRRRQPREVVGRQTA